MASVILYYAHPGQRYSRVNRHMFQAASALTDITVVDLYAEYPRFDINIDREQERLRNHDVIVLQFPLFWYSTPSLVKEWIDLVFEHGFAYGAGGTALSGKVLQLAITAAGPEDAYTDIGYQRHGLLTFLTPLQQTARLCHMRFAPPYVLYGALHTEQHDAANEQAEPTSTSANHIAGFTGLLAALRDDQYSVDKDASHIVQAQHLRSVAAANKGDQTHG